MTLHIPQPEEKNLPVVQLWLVAEFRQPHKLTEEERQWIRARLPDALMQDWTETDGALLIPLEMKDAEKRREAYEAAADALTEHCARLFSSVRTADVVGLNAYLTPVKSPSPSLLSGIRSMTAKVWGALTGRK